MEVLNTSDISVEELVEAPDEILEVDESGNAIGASVSKSDIKKEIRIVPKEERLKRPDMVEAKVYKLKSRFVNENLYITLSYIRDENGSPRPIEVFINSKDLSRLPEYTVLTRLISAIFRNFSNPSFILEELSSIYDPNGGYFSKGKYIYSFYSEIAVIIEKFFIDIGFMKGKDEGLDNWIENAKKLNPEYEIDENNFKICPQCNHKSLQLDGGCLQCINPECGYSKCN